MPNFFSDHSPYLAHPLLTSERTDGEVGELIRILGVDHPADVLDVGCGFGRHCIAFARLGHRVVGLDPSQTMVDAARAATAADGLAVDYRVSSGEALDQVDAFDGAIAMFTTLGQIGSDGVDNRAMLEPIHRALRPGARLVIEVPRRTVAVANLIEHDAFGEGPNRTEIARRFDATDNKIVEHFLVVTDGVERNFDLEVRLFEPDEVVDLLAGVGFSNITLAGVLADAPGLGSELSPDAASIVATAQA